MSIANNVKNIIDELKGYNTKLIAVTKNRTLDELSTLYQTGHKTFGENRVQELVSKYEALPKDIEWHLIGHLQTNKVKYIAPFVACIHSIDSLKLLQEVNKQAEKYNRVINCLFQIYIAKEESKFGLEENELKSIIESEDFKKLKNIKIIGLMGMATNTDNEATIKNEFQALKNIFEQYKNLKNENLALTELSMGMSSDYKIAIKEGSTMIRVGSLLFS